MPVSAGLEAELGADVDALAVLLGGLRDRREAVALLRIAHAGGDIEVAGQAIAAADVDCLVAARIDRARAGAGLGLLFDREPRSEAAFARARARRRLEFGEV